MNEPPTAIADGTVLLEGVVGSTAYGLRSTLLCAPRVRDAYLGYARQQALRLMNKSAVARSPGRVAKHARHLLRLVHQGIELYTTGRLTVRLADPQRYLDFGTAVVTDPTIAREALSEAESRLDSAPTALPSRPDTEAAEMWLLRVRDAYP